MVTILPALRLEDLAVAEILNRHIQFRPTPFESFPCPFPSGPAT